MRQTVTSQVPSCEAQKLGPIRSEAAILEPLERYAWPGISPAHSAFDPCSLVDVRVCRVLLTLVEIRVAGCSCGTGRENSPTPRKYLRLLRGVEQVVDKIIYKNLTRVESVGFLGGGGSGGREMRQRGGHCTVERNIRGLSSSENRNLSAPAVGQSYYLTLPIPISEQSLHVHSLHKEPSR
jgi:hypothetical protein